ncbi:MAG: hypothetical protein LUH22_09430 [Bacteroides sp.]|nr:hypothetical protein [Bacteroides sp.]
MRNRLLIYIGLLIFFTSWKTGRVEKLPPSEIAIQWTSHVKGDFSFKKSWSYPEGIFRNEFGQLSCDGLCPPEINQMKDEDGKILTDSLNSFYNLVDTTHLYHSIRSEANTYEWGGTNFITVRRIDQDSVIGYTHCNVSTHSSLYLIIVGNKVTPTIVLESITNSTGTKVFLCVGGEISMDKKLWKENILKASFDFKFKDPENPNKPMFWKGWIYTKIG